MLKLSNSRRKRLERLLMLQYYKGEVEAERTLDGAEAMTHVLRQVRTMTREQYDATTKAAGDDSIHAS